MYDYIFCFIKPEDVAAFLKIFRRLRGVKIIEYEYDKKYKDFYFRIEKRKDILDYGFKDFFENFDLEYEP